MATLFEVLQFFDNNGDPLSAGKLYWYAAGTSTLKNTWKDEAESALHTNPIILGADGRPPAGAIFIRGSYKLIIKNWDDSVTYHTIDNLNEYNQFDLTGLTASIADLNSTTTSIRDIGGAIPLVYTVLLSDRGKTLMVNALTGPSTINLPSAVTLGNTFKFWIKKTDKSNNTVTIVPFGAQTIDGATNKVLYDYNDFIEVRNDGSNWLLGGDLERGTIVNASTAVTVTLQDNNNTYNCNTASGSFTVNLPACATVGRGFTVGFKKIDSSVNEVTLHPNGTETIDGATDYFINTQWQFTRIKTDGSNWFILDESGSATESWTGKITPSMTKTVPGWVWMNNGTIGNAASGATSRANADCKDLFVLLWTNVSNSWCPVTPGGHGASALADFNANKQIAIPEALGRVLTGTGKCNPLAYNDWVIGQYGGEEAHTLTITEMPWHNHTYVGWWHDGSLHAPSDGSWFSASTADNTGPSGGSGGHSQYQPTLAVYWLIKL